MFPGQTKNPFLPSQVNALQKATDSNMTTSLVDPNRDKSVIFVESSSLKHSSHLF